MKLLFASDLHGDLAAVRRLIEVYRAEGAARLVLLGDILYHGPRNDLPAAYDPRGVIALLNAMKDEIIAVRGNCDAEVDQMVLDFPILTESAVLPLEGGVVAHLTHGHHRNEDAPPAAMGARDVLIHGHSHVAGVTSCKTGHACLNPGSVSIPKEGTPHSYMTLENGKFLWKNLETKEIYKEYEI